MPNQSNTYFMNLELFPEMQFTNWHPDEIERMRQCLAGQTVYANRTRDTRLIRWAKQNGLYAYVGRGTIYGNRFVIPTHGDRTTVCERFEREQLPSIAHLLEPLRGKVLECYCYPLRCHAQSIIAAINQTSVS
jgi:hypothetical protein